MSDAESIVSDISEINGLENVFTTKWENITLQKNILEVYYLLKENISDECDREYYLILLKFLKETEMDHHKMEACGFLLKHFSQRVSDAILRHTTGIFSSIVSKMMSESFNKHEEILKYAIFCTGRWLSVLGSADKKLSNNVHCFSALLPLTRDLRMKISKKAVGAVMNIFHSMKENGTVNEKHPFVKEALKTLTTVLNQKSVQVDKRAQKSNNLNNDIELSLSLNLVSKLMVSECLDNKAVFKFVGSIKECLYNIQTVEIQQKIMQIFADLFRHEPLTPSNMDHCIKFLFEYIRFITDAKAEDAIQPCPPLEILRDWLVAVQVGFERLVGYSSTRNAALAHANTLLRLCSDWLLSDEMQIRRVVKEKLLQLTTGHFVSRENAQDYLNPELNPIEAEDVFKGWLSLLRRYLRVESEIVLTDICTVIGSLVVRSQGKLSIVNGGFVATVLDVLPYLADLRDSIEGAVAHRDTATTKPLKTSIEALIGNCMSYYDVVNVIRVLPLQQLLSSETMTEMTQRTWILPLMKEFVTCTSLDSFRLIILPCIHIITARMSSLQQHATGSAYKSLGLVRMQLWECLPLFCTNCPTGSLSAVANNRLEPCQMPDPMDDARSSPTLFELMVQLINPTYPSNLETVVFKALRKLMTTSQEPDEAKAVLTSAVFFPVVLKHSFILYLANPDFAISIKSFLDLYLELFPVDTVMNNCMFIQTKKLSDMDPASPTDEHTKCFELLTILAPHLSSDNIHKILEYMHQFLADDAPVAVSHKIQKKVYRFLEIITDCSTEHSNQYIRDNIYALITQFAAWKNVKSDSWKCRIKCLYNLFKMLNTEEEVSSFMDNFLSEIVICLNEKNKKARSVAGLVLVEAIIARADFSDDCDQTLGTTLNKMIVKLLHLLNTNVADQTYKGICFKGALSKAIILVLTEPRLRGHVQSQHINDIFQLVKELFRNHKEEAGLKKHVDRHLVHCGLDILKRLLKNSKEQFGDERIVEVCQCIKTCPEAVLSKVRMSMKKILKNMLTMWDYEKIKKDLPTFLLPVLRNIHKNMNRQKRRNTENDSDSDNGVAESVATSWGGGSDASNKTMRNPHFKNIAEILDNSDDEDDDDLKTTATASTSASKKSCASEMRKQRKRKIEEANARLYLEEKEGDVIDLNDPTSLIRNLKISSRKRPLDQEEEPEKKDKNCDKRGFKIMDGKLVIEKEGAVNKNNNVDSDEGEDLKGRFQPLKKKVKIQKPKIIGSDYSGKKGVLGDVKRRNMPDPYAVVTSADIKAGALRKYSRKMKETRKQTILTSKTRNKKKKM